MTNTSEKLMVVVPWHNPVQRDAFLEAWSLTGAEPFLVLEQDKTRAGCARTKNAGVMRAMELGASIVIVLDDDCFPCGPTGPQGASPTVSAAETVRDGFVAAPTGAHSIIELMAAHRAALAPQAVPMCEAVTDPPSRGTPYFCRTLTMPVAASMGFWTEVGDYDACGQLAHGATHPMTFRRGPIFGRYFPLCGMNLAFRPREWDPWWHFIDVARFDDIWQGFLWQREAIRRGACFNLAGPLVRHSRQSNVWANLRDEAVHLEANDTLWRTIATHPASDYATLRALLPV